jgi:hypothetical protein
VISLPLDGDASDSFPKVSQHPRQGTPFRAAPPDSPLASRGEDFDG